MSSCLAELVKKKTSRSKHKLRMHDGKTQTKLVQNSSRFPHHSPQDHLTAIDLDVSGLVRVTTQLETD